MCDVKLVMVILAITTCIVLACVAFGIGGYHFVHKPTPDELFGCTVEQQTPDGECK